MSTHEHAAKIATEIAAAAEKLARSAASFGEFWRSVSDRVERGESLSLDNVPNDIALDMYELKRLVVLVASAQIESGHPRLTDPGT